MIVDAYAHIAWPKFGRPAELLATWEQWKIAKGCIALPPSMPDFSGLEEARKAWGDRVRLFGIPYGETERDRTLLIEGQLEFGVAGLRLMPNEVMDNREGMRLLGEAGCCLMAINPYDRADLTRFLLDWLERYPNGRVASPHFLRPAGITGATVDHPEGGCGAPVADPDAFRELLAHPRMYAIFSRHGGASSRPYPHEDLRPWVDEILPLLGWERVMWGSEIPVVFHRDETMDEVIGWLESLGVTMSPDDRAAYLGGNAERCFFASAPPATSRSAADLPPWAAEGLARFVAGNSSVPVIRTRALDLPMDLHGTLQSAYYEALRTSPGLRFQEWLVERLGRIDGSDTSG